MRAIDTEGLVRIYEKGDPPLFLMNGESFVFAPVPEGSRVLYARPPLKGWRGAELRAKAEQAIDNPIGMEPLKALLRPGMRVTIAFDDISLSEPILQAPDCRQVVIELLLERLAQAGVDDVELVVAVCLHRHMHSWELKEMLGKKIFNAHWHNKTLYNYDAEDKDGNIVLGYTENNEIVEMHKRSATSDLLIYVNLNLIALNGGHKSVGVGLVTYRCVRSNHNYEHQFNSRSFNDPPRSKMHSAINRIGRYIEKHIKVFHIEMTVNTDTFPHYLGFMQKQELEWSFPEKIMARINKHLLDLTPLSLNRKIFFANKAPYTVTSIQAGEAEAVHQLTLQNIYKQQLIDVDGQSDILIIPIPYVMPYSVNSIMNPILVYAMGLGYMFNFYMNKPLVKQGGTIIFLHPLENKFDQIHHPSYIELFDKLKETRDPRIIDKKYADLLATDERYIHLYRFHNAYHGFHPVSMWNWGSYGMSYVGQIITVNPKSREAAERLGWQAAPNLNEAIEMAKTKQGRSATISVIHSPPIAMWNVK